MDYIQFLIMLNSVGGLTWKRFLRRVEPLVIIVLISYGQHILWILSTRPLTYGRHTVVSFRVSSSIRQSRFLGADVMRSGLLLRWRLCLKLIISSWYAWISLLMAFDRYCKRRTIPFFTLYGWWKLKLRYCSVNVGLRYTVDLDPCSVRITNKLSKFNLSCSFSLWWTFGLSSCDQIFWPLAPAQKYYSKVIHRKEVTHSNGQWSKEIAWAD